MAATALTDLRDSEDRSTGYCSAFQIAGVSVRIDGQSVSDVQLARSLQSFQVQSTAPDIYLHVEWAELLAAPPRLKSFESGSVWRLYEDDSHFVFDFSSDRIAKRPYKRLITDKQFRNAQIQMCASCLSRGSPTVVPLEYPLDELLITHRLTQERAIELHGTGIVCANGDANLFVGHSGAGKSTTTRLWKSVEEVEVLSDDRIIVRGDLGSRCCIETPVQSGDGASKHGVLRLSAQDDKKYRMYGTPWHGEAMYSSPHSASLTRIFVLEHGHGNVATPLSSSHAVAELFARSFVPFHRHEYVDSALAFLESLANAVPIYRYAFEPDQRAVENIRNFHD